MSDGGVDVRVTAAVDQFLAALAHGDMQSMCKIMVCPGCGAGHPVFHSPVGTTDTACSGCGWSSVEGGHDIERPR